MMIGATRKVQACRCVRGTEMLTTQRAHSLLIFRVPRGVITPTARSGSYVGFDRSKGRLDPAMGP